MDVVDLKNKTYLFDGAFGTYYASITHSVESCETANLNDPKTVSKIHQQYIDAGVNAIKTNTFGVNSGLDLDFSQQKEIIKSGYTLAVQAVKNTEVSVFADIGPIPYKDTDISLEYIDIADVFLDLGADKFLFETMPEYNALKPVLKHIKQEKPNSFIVVSFAAGLDGYTKSGHYYKQLLDMAQNDEAVDAIGLNCLCGPAHILQLVKDYSPIKPMSVMPNSGYPESVGNRLVYIDNADYFAEKLLELRQNGIKILGGCCGTTPQHIKKSRILLDQFGGEQTVNIEIKSHVLDKKTVHNNAFFDKLRQGKYPVAVELRAPLDTDIEYLLSGADNLKSLGADVITIADSPLSRTRADSFMISSKINREVNIDVLPHLTCRDKNIISIKAALLGLNIEGVNNVFIITGDPIVATERSSIKGVFDFNSIGLIKYIKSLNQNVFNDNPFLIGAALNTNAVNFDFELNRAKQKIQAGANFFLTQPVLTDESIEKIKKAKQTLNTYILAGIIPPISYKNAVFLNNEVSGISIPNELLEKLKSNPQNEAEVSIEFSLGVIKQLRQVSDGLYIISQSKKASLINSIVQNVKSF